MYNYPEPPKNVFPEKLQPSAAFKKQVSKVLISILAFFIVYLLLVIAAAGLAIGCFYAGFYVMYGLSSFAGLMLGLGVMALGVSVIFFLIKFIFAISKNENDARIEITEAEQPELFAFIRKLTDETKTPFPRKIFLSPEVNACVFYNSSFWSMFFPVRKNLEIGLGLVNSINISEFKAVMAHEFGHFSQRSMKLGSFTYNVNRIIYNMLYENRSYTNFLNTWGNVSSYLALFAGITVKIAQGIQWILKGMYKLINKNYLSMSREMEFHADAVAASVSGGNNLVSALSRLELASACYQTALNKADGWLKEQKIAKNIFSNQLTVYRETAREHGLILKNGLPDVSYSFIKSFTKSKINYTDQWASHPTLTERKQRLEALEMNIPANETPAWKLFQKTDLLQENMTANLYTKIKLEPAKIEYYDDAQFEESYLKDAVTYSLPIEYKGYYDKRFLNFSDWDFDSLANKIPEKNFGEIFTDENGQLQSSIASLLSDIQIVKAIKNKAIDVRSFDFNGEKYTSSNCDTVIEKLQEEMNALQQKQNSVDKEAYSFFYNAAKQECLQIKDNYHAFKEISDTRNAYIDTAQKTMETVAPLYNDGNSLEFITGKISELKHSCEPKFKKQLRLILEQNMLTPEKNKDLYIRTEAFLKKEYGYFIDNEFQNDELNELHSLVVAIANHLDKEVFFRYKHTLQEQLRFYNAMQEQIIQTYSEIVSQ